MRKGNERIMIRILGATDHSIYVLAHFSDFYDNNSAHTIEENNVHLLFLKEKLKSI